MYALINAGVVVSVQEIDATTADALTGYDLKVKCSYSVQVGDLYDAATGFTKPDSSHYAKTVDTSAPIVDVPVVDEVVVEKASLPVVDVIADTSSVEE
jgi:hypothetical protein